MKYKKFIDDNKFRSDRIPGRIGPYIHRRGTLTVVNAVAGAGMLDHFGVWVLLFDPDGEAEPVVIQTEYSQLLPIEWHIGRNKTVRAEVTMRGTHMEFLVNNKRHTVLLSPAQRDDVKYQFDAM